MHSDMRCGFSWGLSAKSIVQINDWISYSRASDVTVLILMQSSHASWDKVTTCHCGFIFKVISIISGSKKNKKNNFQSNWNKNLQAVTQKTIIKSFVQFLLVSL